MKQDRQGSCDLGSCNLGGGKLRARRIAAGYLLPVAALLAPALLPAPLAAQPVVQPLPGGSTQTLNSALARLARDPRDLGALIDAGNAALQVGDIDAATGFFARADQLSPNNMRVKAGLASALVRSANPYDAIPMFAEAERAGVNDPLVVSDRGLAYDLVGDNATAQRYYRQSLSAAPNDETQRRLALSQAIAGDRAGMEQTLSPLLQRQDKAAWRTRAFALAILGRPDEAVAIANQSMPTDLANGIAPYLRYMPRLTAAQQAAAANFGRFPRAAEIGRDDPRVALYAPPKRVASTADAPLVPAGTPLGRSRTSVRQPAPARAAAVTPPVAPAAMRSAPPEPMPDRQVGAPPQLVATGELPPRTAAAPLPVAPAPSPAPTPARVPVFAPVTASIAPSQPAPSQPAPIARPAPVPAPVQAALPAPAPAVASPAPAPASASGFDLARVVAAQSGSAAPGSSPAAPPAPAPAFVDAPHVPSAPAPVAASAPAPAPVRRPAPPARVADAFGDFTVSKGVVAPAPGAVDVRKIAAAKPKPPEPKKPAHPSRIWVQVGTGRDLRALAFTWRGLVKDNPALLRGKDAMTSDWGRTNRLLTGPFPTEAAAEAYLVKLKKAGLDAFEWISPAGQVVDDLPGT
ncbi:tetratricopeptide repeat protein [Novosphingobium flavum]|uniref:tetratricopeptide repeat protein n=1 Tax=Novosphingobium flavum TaxID=1778672 RepID=UPI0031B5CA4D